jgi:NAD(P)-dependent dehydrogenase (short-subunit alcohol dehydrogenase family)
MSSDANSGRVAVITGASSGIGEATAPALAPTATSQGRRAPPQLAAADSRDASYAVSENERRARRAGASAPASFRVTHEVTPV